MQATSYFGKPMKTQGEYCECVCSCWCGCVDCTLLNPGYSSGMDCYAGSDESSYSS